MEREFAKSVQPIIVQYRSVVGLILFEFAIIVFVIQVWNILLETRHRYWNRCTPNTNVSLFDPTSVSDDRISMSSDISSDETEIRARRVTEAVVNTFSSVASVLEYPKSMKITYAKQISPCSRYR